MGYIKDTKTSMEILLVVSIFIAGLLGLLGFSFVNLVSDVLMETSFIEYIRSL